MADEDQPAETFQTDGDAVDVEEELPAFDVQISLDNMEAKLCVLNAPSVKQVSYESVMEFLKEKSIVFGLMDESIHHFCDEGKYQVPFVCAKGIPSIDGTDGTLTYHVEIKKELKPKERDDGTVDYRELGFVQNVKKGEVLCERTAPTVGKNGTDVFGRVLNYIPGLLPDFRPGEHTVVSDDGMSLLADIDGSIVYKDDLLSVCDVYIIHGNVDNVTGNIRTVGSIIVHGDVLDGFSVISEKDITINGMVEGAYIEAKGNITIKSGMIGMEHGILKADGTVTARYLQNTTVEAKGDVYADTVLNCHIEAEGSVVLKGKMASLIGGSCKVGKTISLKNLGNDGHTKTAVTIGSKQLSEIYALNKDVESLNELQINKTKFEQALDALQKRIDTIAGSLSEEGQQNLEAKRIWLKAAEAKVEQINAAIQSLQKLKESAESQNLQLCDFYVMVTGIAYTGVSIEIGPYHLQLQQDNSCTKFYGNREQITFSPLQP